MQVTVAVSGTAAVIKLQGRFDFNTHREFRENTDGVVSNAQVKDITVDFSGTDYLDSSALGMLLMLRDKASTLGKKVSLSNCRGPVKQVLDIANFGKLFEIA